VIDPQWQQARKILVVRLDNLGDVLLATPAMHALKVALPEAQITLLASPVGAQAGYLNRDIDDVIEYEAPWVDPWQRTSHDPAREQAMIEQLRRAEFDAAIIFTSFRQSPLPAAYLSYLAGIPLRLAASVDAPGSLLTTRHRHPERAMHEVERGLDLVGAIGIPSEQSDLVIDVPADARRHAQMRRRELLRISDGERHGPFVMVHPGCSMPARTYPAEQYSEVIDALVTDLNATVVLTGVDTERDLVAGIRRGVHPSGQPHVHDLAASLSFPDLCALVGTADLLVTNNTGPMHIAAAMDTPVIALFALTNPPEQWRPWKVPHRLLNNDVPCRICYQRICPFEQECIRSVSATDVLAAARDLGVGCTSQGEPVKWVAASPAMSESVLS